VRLGDMTDILYVSQVILNIVATLTLLLVIFAMSSAMYYATKTAKSIRQSLEKIQHHIENIKIINIIHKLWKKILR